MEKRYFLALFNEKTWNEFLSQKQMVYGTNKNKIENAKKVKKGDFLICYLSKISEFVGILIVTSDVYYDEFTIWEDNVYPVRLNVQPVIVFPVERGISISQFKNKLTIFKKLKNKNRWGGFFNNAFNEFPSDDGILIHHELGKE